MTRFWRIAAVLSALCVALAAMAMGASAAKPHGGKSKAKPKPTGARVDTSFGTKGVAKIATGGKSTEVKVRMAVAPNGTSYVLQGSLLLAFEPNGKPAKGFGNNGRVRLTSSHGELFPTDVAVDSQGRVLVDGKITLYPFASDPPIPADAEAIESRTLREAFVNRYLPDGSLDPTFGNAGEADTTFGLPRPTGQPGSGVEFERALVEATTLTVDSEDRPVVGGSYSSAVWFCGYVNEHPAPFVGRLTASGAVDTSYAGKGYVAGGQGEVKALAETPEGGVATLSEGRTCGPRSERTGTIFNSLTATGEANPILDPTRPMSAVERPTVFAEPMIAVDSRGRSLVAQASDPYTAEPVLARLRPSGAVDPGFGSEGTAPLFGGVTFPGALAVDAKNRTLVVELGIEAPNGPRVIRYAATGKRDSKFGRGGVVEGPIVNDRRGGMTAMAVDAKGRIYVAGWVESKTLKTGHGIQITRFLAN
jgi:uncharacterized delta-60 repeat protein